MDFENLSEEIKEKAKACASSEELLALAKAEGIELSEDQIAQIAGGEAGWGVEDTCPNNIVPNADPFDPVARGFVARRI